MDMLAIGNTIRENNPHRAETFVAELYECCLGLGSIPEAYPLVPRHEASGLRRRLFGNYLIFYRIAEKQVEVIHILHGARDYERILFLED